MGRRRAWITAVALLVVIVTAMTAALIIGLAVSSAGTDIPAGRGGPFASPVDRTRVDRLLDAQAAALLAGDEQGWLAVADQTTPDVVARYRQLYSTLRALQVTWFEYDVPADIVHDGPGPRIETIPIRYCVGGVACDKRSEHGRSQMGLHFTERHGRWWVDEIADPAVKWDSARKPPPWLADPLQVRTHNGVIVAAPAALAGQLDAVATAADRATAVINRYARPDTTPPTYVIYLASSPQWEAWNDDSGSGKNTLGVAITHSDIQMSIILHMDRIDTDQLDGVVRHEMGHVITMIGLPDGQSRLIDPNDWVAEGIAEYIAWTGRPRTDYPRLPGIDHYVRTGRWDGTVPVHIARYESLAIDATYGLNYLMICYLADRFGEPVMLRLVDELLRNDNNIDDTTPQVIGQDWPTLAADIAAHLRRTVG